MSETILTPAANPPPTALRAHGFTPWLKEARALVMLGAPLILTQLAQMAMPTTDILMLGYLGEEALAATALAHTIYIFAWLAGLGPSSAVAPIIAHVLGAKPGERAGVRAAVRMGLWSVLLLTPPLVALLLFAEPLLRALGQTPELAHLAAPYVQILAVGVPFSLGFFVLRNFATALSRPRAPLLVVGVAVLLNALLDYGLIFGHLGMPRLGMMGGAVATTTSNAFTFFALAGLVTFAPTFRPYRIWRRFHRADWTRLKEIFRLGGSIGLTMIFEIALFAGSTLLMGPFGTAAVAAHQIAMNVPSVTFMVPLGLAMAASVRVGLAAGAGDAAGVRRAGFAAIAIGMCYMSLSAIAIAGFPRAIASLYIDVDDPDNAATVRLAVSFLYVAAAFQVLDGVQVLASFALRGLKDVHVPMWLAGVSYWVIGLPLALLFGFGMGLQGLGVWLGLAASIVAAASLLLARFAWLSGVLRRSAGSCVAAHGQSAVTSGRCRRNRPHDSHSLQ
jgi:multidrug resistance protein, MATE family